MMSDPEQRGHAMDWLTPDEAARARFNVARHNFIMMGMKVALPSIALAVFLAVMIWSSGNSPVIKNNKVDAIDATMRDASFESRDDDNHPYKLEAPVAKQNPNAPGTVDLSNPTSSIDLGEQGTIKGNANSAHYDQNKGTLDVDGKLVLRKDDGTTFTTDSAQIDVNNRTVKGDKPVVLQGTFGEVRGQGIDVKDGGKIITFTGPSSATLKLGSQGAALPGSTPPTPTKAKMLP